MGGALAIILAGRFPLAGYLLYAPAVVINSPLMPYMGLLRHFVKRAANASLEEERDPDRQYLAAEYWRWRYPSALAQLWRVSSLARGSIRDVDCDTLVLVSEKDRSVRLEAAERILRGVKPGVAVSAVKLEESGHVIVNDCEKDKVAGLTLDWLASKGERENVS